LVIRIEFSAELLVNGTQVCVFDIDISRVVTEYQAQRLVNEKGQCFIAPFPDEVTKAVQYGNGMTFFSVGVTGRRFTAIFAIESHSI
jgi:hypothetical protein